MNNLKLSASLAAHIGAIVAANWMTARLGLVPVGFGLVAIAGTFAAGFALLARDFVHRYGGARWALVGIIAAGLISWVMSTPALALASTVAFVVAELADLAVYSRLRRRGFATAAIASNTIGAPLDTVLFLVLAGFPLTWPVILGQLVGKIVWATLIPVGLYVLVTRGRR